MRSYEEKIGNLRFHAAIILRLLYFALLSSSRSRNSSFSASLTPIRLDLVSFRRPPCCCIRSGLLHQFERRLRLPRLTWRIDRVVRWVPVRRR